MKDNFNLRKFLTENKLTPNSRVLKEEDFDSVDRLAAFTDTLQVVGIETVEDALEAIERYKDGAPLSREEAKDLVAGMRDTDEDDYDRNITNLVVKAFNIKLKGVSENKIDTLVSEDYEPGSIAPADLYYSDKHGKLVAMDDVDDKYHDSLELVYSKGDKIEDIDD